MSRLTRDESGLALVLVAVVLIALLALVAFAVDVGALYAERRELQSGADAAVLAIAADCGKGLACDSATALTTADDYAGANAKDLEAGIHALSLDTSARSIEVTTQTEEPGGSTIFAPFFAQVIGFEGSTVGAHAAARWDYPAGGVVIPIIVSDCEWDRMPAPENVPPGAEYILYFHDGKAAEECNANPGLDKDEDGKLPGGFGWLDTGGSDCVADVLAAAWAFADPGSSAPHGCTPSYFASQIFDKTVAIPYFNDYDGVAGGGGNGGYYVSGLGGFHVTGYDFRGGFRKKSLITGKLPCKKDERCIAGYPATAEMDGGIPGGEDRGAYFVTLTE